MQMIFSNKIREMYFVAFCSTNSRLDYIVSFQMPYPHTHLRDMEPGHQRAYRWPGTIWLTIHDKVWPIFVKNIMIVS